MTDTITLYQFGLILLVILAAMLVLTLAFQQTPFFAGVKITDVLGVIVTLALV
jgi:hypothetical protein